METEDFSGTCPTCGQRDCGPLIAKIREIAEKGRTYYMADDLATEIMAALDDRCEHDGYAVCRKCGAKL